MRRCRRRRREDARHSKGSGDGGGAAAPEEVRRPAAAGTRAPRSSSSPARSCCTTRARASPSHGVPSVVGDAGGQGAPRGDGPRGAQISALICARPRGAPRRTPPSPTPRRSSRCGASPSSTGLSCSPTGRRRSPSTQWTRPTPRATRQAVWGVARARASPPTRTSRRSLPELYRLMLLSHLLPPPEVSSSLLGRCARGRTARRCRRRTRSSATRCTMATSRGAARKKSARGR